MPLRPVLRSKPESNASRRGACSRRPAPGHATEWAARDEAVRIVDRWNADVAAGRGALSQPSVHCPGCGTSHAIDARTLDQHPLATIGSLVIGSRCSMCLDSAPMTAIHGLLAFTPAAKYTLTI